MLISEGIQLVRDDLADEGETPRLSDAQGLRQFQRAVRIFNTIIANSELPIGVKTSTITLVASQQNYSKPDDFMKPLILDDGSGDGGLLWVDPEQWARMDTASRTEKDVWTIFDDELQIAGTPTSAATLTLYYYPTITTSTYSIATTLPWDGLLDDALVEFVKIRWMSIDEYGLAQDAQLADSLTKAVLAGIRPIQQGAYAGNFPEYD